MTRVILPWRNVNCCPIAPVPPQLYTALLGIWMSQEPKSNKFVQCTVCRKWQKFSEDAVSLSKYFTYRWPLKLTFIASPVSWIFFIYSSEITVYQRFVSTEFFDTGIYVHRFIEKKPSSISSRMLDPSFFNSPRAEFNPNFNCITVAKHSFIQNSKYTLSFLFSFKFRLSSRLIRILSDSAHCTMYTELCA